MGEPDPTRSTRDGARMALLVLHAAVAATAAAGGAVMSAGSIWPGLGGGLVPPTSYLEGSPFTSYLVPGLLLLVLLGGVHALAFIVQLRRTRHAVLWSAVAAFDLLIWIFVQMVYIPFSVLQVLYFAAGAAEAGLVMLALGVLRPLGRRPAS